MITKDMKKLAETFQTFIDGLAEIEALGSLDNAVKEREQVLAKAQADTA